MASRILALDPATMCGWAHSCGTSGTWDLSTKKDESGGMKLIRLVGKLDEMYMRAGVDLVVFEAQRGGNRAFLGSLVVQSEIQGCIKLWCERMDIPYRGYSPSEIKKHATGKGNSGKEKMMEAAKARWPRVEFVDDNQADACWLLSLGTSEYGIQARKILKETQGALTNSRPTLNGTSTRCS